MRPYLKVYCRYILCLSQIRPKNYIKSVIQKEINKSIITTCHVKKSFKLTKYKFWLSSSHWCANRLQHTNNIDKYTNGRNKKVAEDDVEHDKIDSIFDLKTKIGKIWHRVCSPYKCCKVIHNHRCIKTISYRL